VIPLPPPEPFTWPAIICPACGHGIDPHGTDPGGPCGVGMVDDTGLCHLCPCMWSPNDIAGNATALHRRRVAESRPTTIRGHVHLAALRTANAVLRVALRVLNGQAR